MGQLGVSPRDFWKLTFSEFWSIHNGRFGDPEPHVSGKDVQDWEKSIEKIRAKKAQDRLREKLKEKHGEHRARSTDSQARG